MENDQTVYNNRNLTHSFCSNHSESQATASQQWAPNCQELDKDCSFPILSPLLPVQDQQETTKHPPQTSSVGCPASSSATSSFPAPKASNRAYWNVCFFTIELCHLPLCLWVSAEHSDNGRCLHSNELRINSFGLSSFGSSFIPICACLSMC